MPTGFRSGFYWGPSIPPGLGRRVWELAPWIAGLLAVGLHLGALPAGFTFDDPHIIVENPIVTGGSGLGLVFTTHYWAGLEAAGTLYRPLTMTSYWLQYRVMGSAPWSWHLVNLLLHGMVTVLVCRLAGRLVGGLEWSGQRASAGDIGAAGALAPSAVAAALLFAVHPIHTEAVANITGRAELMAALGVLGAWLWRDRLLVALPLCTAAVFSKESAVVLPGLLLAEDVILKRRVRALALLPFVAVVAAFLVVRVMVVGPGLATPIDPFVGVPAAYRVMTAIEVLGREVLLMLAPMKLSADYSFNQIPVVTTPLHLGFLAGLLIVGACLWTAWSCRHREPAIAFGITAFFVALLPVSNLFFGIGVMMAERLLYLPSVGACLAGGVALAVVASRLRERYGSQAHHLWGHGSPAHPGAPTPHDPRALHDPSTLHGSPARHRSPTIAEAVVAVTLVVCIPPAARTARRTQEWFDQVTLFEATVRTSPYSALAHVNLGAAYQKLGRLIEAEMEFRAALSIAPDRPGVHFNLGSCLEAQGRLAEAAIAYEKALHLAPDDPRPAESLARLRRSRPASE